MDRLWTPWRYHYISTFDDSQGCIFCRALQEQDDEKNLVLHRGAACFVILNLYPYTNGHIMVVTNRHVALLHEASPDELLEMMRVAQRCQRALTDAYHPDGFNLGINQGRCAGAGVADHLHLHILARWAGDSSFMSVVAETRVLPEELSTTYRKLRPFFCDDSPSE